MSYAYRINGSENINLDSYPTKETGGLKKEEAEYRTSLIIQDLVELQELLYAVHREKILIVLQGRDTSGKDGTIRHVFGPLDSSSCSVTSFKVPTEEELAHDFLWRVHEHTPPSGHIKIFNRSHYEDILVVRVHGLAPTEVWITRFAHINAFERLLVNSQTILLKFYLHISKEEQEERLLEREKSPIKAWKLAAGDWKERNFWTDYTEAYEDMLKKCSTEYAPWYIIPADKKWYRNLAVAEVVRDALAPYKKSWMEELDKMGQERRAELEEYRAARQQ